MAPYAEVKDITEKGAAFVFYSHNLDKIDDVSLQVIAMKKSGSAWSTQEIPAKEVKRGPDSIEYRLRFDQDVKPEDNDFSFQLTYTEDGKKDDSPRVIIRKILDLRRGTAEDA